MNTTLQLSYGTGVQDRPDHDFYETPEWGTLALLEKEQFIGAIWEPACGKGGIAIPLERAGYEVWSTDIVNRGRSHDTFDFLTSNYMTDNVVTNPPFNLAEQFLCKAWESTTQTVAFLLRLQFLESKGRFFLFEKIPPTRIHVLSERIGFTKNGVSHSGGMVSHAWFVWDHRNTGNVTSLDWIKPRESRNNK